MSGPELSIIKIRPSADEMIQYTKLFKWWTNEIRLRKMEIGVFGGRFTFRIIAMDDTVFTVREFKSLAEMRGYLLGFLDALEFKAASDELPW